LDLLRASPARDFCLSPTKVKQALVDLTLLQRGKALAAVLIRGAAG
jgi:hypothetical protein